MTNELEKQFFDTFEIEKTCNNKIINPAKCPINKMRRCCGCDWLDYPQINNRILLELICIISNYCQTKLQCDYQLYSVNIDELRQEVLRDCMEYCCKPIDIEFIKHQVRTLFEEG